VGVAALQISNIKFQISRWYAVGTGILLGAGLLAKLGGLILIPLVGLALLIRWLRKPSLLRPEISNLVFVFGVAALVSGGWFIRNIALYGDVLGWNVWLSDIGVRTPTPALWQLVPELPALFRTYWADFNGLRFDDGLYGALALMCLVALVGVIKFQISLKSPSGQKSKIAGRTSDVWCWIFLFAWLGIVVAGVLRYMQTTPAAQGRLLFPALAPIGVLLVLGLATWSERVWPVVGIVIVLLAQTLASPFLIIRPAYARPLVAQLPADAQQASARFGDRVELIGAHIPDHVEPGGTLRVTTYWRVLQGATGDQRLLIRLMRPDGNSAGQLDTTLGTNLYPTTLWQAGQIIVDTHNVRADADLAVPLTLRVHLGVGDETEPLVPVTGPRAWSSGDVAEVGQVQVRR
jgi:4-amino-4-deoxy-L-arabinose transferase-like glycosyltransferase